SVASCSKSSEGCERVLDIDEVVSTDEAAPESLSCRLPKQLGRESLLRTVAQCPTRAGEGHCAKPSTVSGLDIGVVEDNTRRHAKTARPPRARQCEMNVRRQHIGEAVEGKSALV